MTGSDLCPNFSDNTYLDSMRVEIPQVLRRDFLVVMDVWVVYLMPQRINSDCIYAAEFQSSSSLQEPHMFLWSVLIPCQSDTPKCTMLRLLHDANQAYRSWKRHLCAPSGQVPVWIIKTHFKAEIWPKITQNMIRHFLGFICDFPFL